MMMMMMMMMIIIIIIIINGKKYSVFHNKVLFIISIGGLFSIRFGPKGLSSGNTCIKINMKSCWIRQILYFKN